MFFFFVLFFYDVTYNVFFFFVFNMVSLWQICNDPYGSIRTKENRKVMLRDFKPLIWLEFGNGIKFHEIEVFISLMSNFIIRLTDKMSLSMDGWLWCIINTNSSGFNWI